MKLADLEKLVPSFDDLAELVRISAEAHLKAEKLISEIKDLEAKFTRECILVKKYWPRGKSPTATGAYLTKVVPRLGNTPEEELLLKSKRKELAERRKSAQKADNLLELGRAKIAVFQTLSANRRHSLAI